MKFTLPYRQFSAALLLLVYAFIATPVQVWHHHFIQEKDHLNLKNSTGQKNVVAKSNGNFSHNCQICSHKYSVYSNEHFKSEHNLEITWLDLNPLYVFFFKEALRFNLSNKDPPVKA